MILLALLAPTAQATPELGELVAEVVIADEPGHLAFPDLAQLPDGRLLLVYRHGEGHVDDSGRIVRRYGSADGRTWTEPEVAVDLPGIDDRDPSVGVVEGRVALSWFPYRRQELDDGVLVLHQVLLAWSEDGSSFGEPEAVSPGPLELGSASLVDAMWRDAAGSPVPVAACSSPARHLDGQLVVATYRGSAVDLTVLARAPRSRIALVSRGEAGWTPEELLPGAWPEVWLQEPSLLQLPEGDVLVHARTARGDSPSSPGPLVQAARRGGTWTGWEALPLIGHAPYLARLADGTLLSAFREVDEAYTREWVSLLASADDGRTWSGPRRLADCGAHECGYPSIVELDGGEVLVVWYGPEGRSIRGSLFGR